MPEPRALRRAAIPAGAALALAAAAIVVSVGAIVPDGEPAAPSALPFDGRSPRVPEEDPVRVLVELARPSLGERMARRPLDAGEQRAYVRSLGREVRALQSALRAEAVRLEDVVTYARTWNGFAATVATEDLPRLQRLGVRVHPVRRFYPAAQEGAVQAGAHEAGGRAPGPRPPAAPARAGPAGAAPAVALLDSGVDRGHPALGGRVIAGHDAVDGDADPSPGGSRGRRERHGTELAAVLLEGLRAGRRIVAVRVAALESEPETGSVEERGTTDELLSGLEWTVDPDGDGDTGDAVPVALVGVNSPYAGFGRAPEARAASAASQLGTLVVAPAGNEGGRIGRFGTVGSPAAAPAVLAAGAVEGGDGPALPVVRLALAGRHGRATFEGRLLSGPGGGGRAEATALSGPSQADPSGRGRSSGQDVLDYFAVDATPRARGRVVVVPAPAGGAGSGGLTDAGAAAAAAGAAGLVVCDPSGARLHALPGSVSERLPVIGLSGEAARRALELTRDGTARAFIGRARPREAAGPPRRAPASSEGPTYDLARKPDVMAAGTARAPVGAGPVGLVSGTSIAAARTAARAAELHRLRPGWSPTQLAAALMGAAGPGSSLPPAERAAAAPVIAAPAALTFPPRRPGPRVSAAGRIALHNPGRRRVRVDLAARLPGRRTRVVVSPPRVSIPSGGTRRVAVRVRPARGSGAGTFGGMLTARARGGTVRVPLTLHVAAPAPAVLGRLRLVRERGRVRGVRFTAGSVGGEGRRRSVIPLGRLVLRLVDGDGETVRELTPPGGARDLLPGEYAYTLTGETLRELDRGTHRFAASGTGAGPDAARKARRSPPFEAR